MSIVRILILTNLYYSSRRQHHYMPLTRRLYVSVNLSPSSLWRCLCTTSSIRGWIKEVVTGLLTLQSSYIWYTKYRIKNIFIDDSSIWDLNNQYNWLSSNDIFVYLIKEFVTRNSYISIRIMEWHPRIGLVENKHSQCL